MYFMKGDTGKSDTKARRLVRILKQWIQPGETSQGTWIGSREKKTARVPLVGYMPAESGGEAIDLNVERWRMNFQTTCVRHNNKERCKDPYSSIAYVFFAYVRTRQARQDETVESSQAIMNWRIDR